MNTLTFIIGFYIGIGIVHATTELAIETKVDTFQNCWKHRKYMLKHIFGWVYYCYLIFYKNNH